MCILGLWQWQAESETKHNKQWTKASSDTQCPPSHFEAFVCCDYVAAIFALTLKIKGGREGGRAEAMLVAASYPGNEDAQWCRPKAAGRRAAGGAAAVMLVYSICCNSSMAGEISLSCLPASLHFQKRTLKGTNKHTFGWYEYIEVFMEKVNLPNYHLSPLYTLFPFSLKLIGKQEIKGKKSMRQRTGWSVATVLKG